MHAFLHLQAHRRRHADATPPLAPLPRRQGDQVHGRRAGPHHGQQLPRGWGCAGRVGWDRGGVCRWCVLWWHGLLCGLQGLVRGCPWAGSGAVARSSPVRRVHSCLRGTCQMGCVRHTPYHARGGGGGREEQNAHRAVSRQPSAPRRRPLGHPPARPPAQQRTSTHTHTPSAPFARPQTPCARRDPSVNSSLCPPPVRRPPSPQTAPPRPSLWACRAPRGPRIGLTSTTATSPRWVQTLNFKPQTQEGIYIHIHTHDEDRVEVPPPHNLPAPSCSSVPPP